MRKFTISKINWYVKAMGWLKIEHQFIAKVEESARSGGESRASTRLKSSRSD